MEFLIDKNDKDKSGIYMITNVVTGKFYIGSAKSFFNRYKRHEGDFLKKKHHSKYLQRSYDKYGSKKFIFSILELCEINKLIKMEQWYFDNFKPFHREIGYNISPTAGSNLGVKFSDKSVTQRVKSWKNKYSKPIIAISPDGIEKTFDSPSSFANFLEVSKTAISCLKTGRAKTCKGWYIKNMEQNKDYKFFTPEKELVVVKYGKLIDFCKQNNLNHGIMVAIWNKRKNSHKGYVRFDRDDLFKKILAPDGVWYYINPSHQKNFIEKHKIKNKGNFHSLVRGEAKSAEGWRLEKI